MPQYTLYGIIGGIIIGIILTLMLNSKIKKWIPSPYAMGIGMVVPAFFSLSILAGSIIRWLLGKAFKDWMKENLIVGIMIDSTLDATDNGIIEKYCNQNSDSLCNIYGGLYQWDEMMDYKLSDNGNPGITQGIFPIGWHLPTDSEWTELTDFLGGASLAGGKLKETGIVHWHSPNTGATNESGFTALPVGC